MKHQFTVLRAFALLAGLVGGSWMGQSAQAAETTASTATTNASIQEVSPWGLNYFNYMNTPTFEESNGASINHLLTLKYKMNDAMYVSGTFRPDSNFENGKNSVTMGDSYLRVATVLYDGVVTVQNQMRYYLPTSEKSQDRNLMGTLQPRIYVSKSVARWDFLYIGIPIFFINNGSQAAQPVIGHSHWIGATYNLTNKFAFEMGINPEWVNVRGAGTLYNDALTDLGFTYKFTPDLKLTPYVEFTAADPKWASTQVIANLDYTFF